jgi:glutamate formiminotransferase/formiminotetrahydrofolate cyclodeaminase
MPLPLVECIPNFSEARHPEVVESILQSIRAVPGVRILDHHSDLDHNRTVVTFVGDPASVEEAAFQSIAKAATLIDLDKHTGEHPRIGATDVVPFVPLTNVTSQECVEMARRLGQRVGSELNIPVYLYEEAATRPERQNLENIRRGQYEALKAEMGVNPARNPDFGPKAVGPAGATVIGARQPLIAFNVYLTTDDVTIAQKIAKAIRFSSGGIRFIKSIGLLVDGRAQVSMNMTNYRQSPIARVVELVRREAARYGVAIHHTELVGLTPQEALIDAAVWYLQLDQFEPAQLLEQRLFEAQPARTEAQTAKIEPDFLEQLASSSPTPGGGSASAHTAAAAAALVAMVARLTVGKKKYIDVESQMLPVIDQADALRAELIHAVEEDSVAFTAFMSAMKLPKDTPEQIAARESAMEAANLQAIKVPLGLASKCIVVLELAQKVSELGNLNAISDGGTAAALAGAALSGASLNVQINCQSLRDQQAAANFLAELHAYENKAADLQANIKKTITTRKGINLV